MLHGDEGSVMKNIILSNETRFSTTLELTRASPSGAWGPDAIVTVVVVVHGAEQLSDHGVAAAVVTPPKIRFSCRALFPAYRPSFFCLGDGFGVPRPHGQGSASLGKIEKVLKHALARRRRRPVRAQSARWPRATASRGARSAPVEPRPSNRGPRPRPQTLEGR